MFLWWLPSTVTFTKVPLVPSRHIAYFCATGSTAHIVGDESLMAFRISTTTADNNNVTIVTYNYDLYDNS